MFKQTYMKPSTAVRVLMQKKWMLKIVLYLYVQMLYFAHFPVGCHLLFSLFVPTHIITSRVKVILRGFVLGSFDNIHFLK